MSQDAGSDMLVCEFKVTSLGALRQFILRHSKRHKHVVRRATTTSSTATSSSAPLVPTTVAPSNNDEIYGFTTQTTATTTVATDMVDQSGDEVDHHHQSSFSSSTSDGTSDDQLRRYAVTSLYANNDASSDYYTASSSTMTHSSSLSSLNTNTTTTSGAHYPCGRNSATFSTISASSSQIARSAKVQQPKRQESASVLYYNDKGSKGSKSGKTSASSRQSASNHEPTTTRFDKNRNSHHHNHNHHHTTSSSSSDSPPPPPPPRKFSSFTSSSQHSSSTGSHHYENACRPKSSSSLLSASSKTASSNGASGSKMIFLDPSKTHKTSDTEIKAIQKRALMQFYLKQRKEKKQAVVADNGAKSGGNVSVVPVIHSSTSSSTSTTSATLSTAKTADADEANQPDSSTPLSSMDYHCHIKNNNNHANGCHNNKVGANHASNGELVVKRSGSIASGRTSSIRSTDRPLIPSTTSSSSSSSSTSSASSTSSFSTSTSSTGDELVTGQHSLSSLSSDCGGDQQAHRAELIIRSLRKIEILRLEELALNRDIQSNDSLGAQVICKLKKLGISPQESERIDLHCDGIEKVTRLFLSLSYRLQQTENDIKTLQKQEAVTPRQAIDGVSKRSDQAKVVSIQSEERELWRATPVYINEPQHHQPHRQTTTLSSLTSGSLNNNSTTIVIKEIESSPLLSESNHNVVISSDTSQCSDNEQSQLGVMGKDSHSNSGGNHNNGIVVKNDLETLTNKRNKLLSQLEEAEQLQDAINGRGDVIMKIVTKYFGDSADDIADFIDFVRLKSSLLTDLRDVRNRIELGEKQLQALKCT